MKIITVLAIALIFPFMAFLAVGFGMPAFVSLKKATENETPWWGKVILIFGAILWGTAAVFFLFGPIFEHGYPALIGLAIGTILLWLAFKKDRQK